jgi:hypothetical protein
MYTARVGAEWTYTGTGGQLCACALHSYLAPFLSCKYHLCKISLPYKVGKWIDIFGTGRSAKFLPPHTLSCDEFSWHLYSTKLHWRSRFFCLFVNYSRNYQAATIVTAWSIGTRIWMSFMLLIGNWWNSHFTVYNNRGLPLLGAFAKLRNSSCLSVRPSFRPYGKTRLPIDGFSRNLVI